MTDYYPLICKAVAGLEKGTGEARRALYERARTALVGQLRNKSPPLTETEIIRERLALEEAVRKVEAEAARRLRMEPPRPDALSYNAVPTDIPAFDRVEPLDTGSVRPAGETAPREARLLREPAPPPHRPPQPPLRRAEPPSPAHVPVLPVEEHPSLKPAGSRRGMVAVLLTLFVILGIGITVYFQRDCIAVLTGGVRELTPQQQREAAPTPPAQQEQLPAVAQRAVLYEEDPADPNGKRYVGSAIWRTAGSGQGTELAVRCDIEIPERRLAMTLSLRRNTDQTLPASHTAEIMFKPALRAA